MSPRSEEMIDQAQEAREGADYKAKTPPAEEAERYVEGAEDFLSAIKEMLSTGERPHG